MDSSLDPRLHPITNPELHAKAERAALEAYLLAPLATPRDRMKLMDRAARKVFIAHGTPRDVANFFCGIISGLVLERLNPARHA